MKLPESFTKEGHLNVIIETPRSSRNKFTYDETTQLFKLKKVLPFGTSFPIDMGFIPYTKAEDGDPFDVFVFMNGLTFPGCLVECRPLGIIEAEQSDGTNVFRNDRIVAVPIASKDYDNLTNIEDLNATTLADLINFCIYYNEMEGRTFVVKGMKGSEDAITAINAKR
jgi:inorganic pyrophosphatase